MFGTKRPPVQIRPPRPNLQFTGHLRSSQVAFLSAEWQLSDYVCEPGPGRPQLGFQHRDVFGQRTSEMNRARDVRSVVMTGGISLRTARPADYDAIIAVVDDWWGRPVHRALPRLFLDHFHDTSFIAERFSGELAGFLVGFRSPAQRDCAYIQFVGVAPEDRKSGLATLLYQAFFEMAAKDGRRVVRAVTAPVNSASIAFHAAMGFTVSGPIDGYDGPSSAKVIFERRLD